MRNVRDKHSVLSQNNADIEISLVCAFSVRMSFTICKKTTKFRPYIEISKQFIWLHHYCYVKGCKLSNISV